jgi:hypothetical protein
MTHDPFRLTRRWLSVAAIQPTTRRRPGPPCQTRLRADAKRCERP